MIGRFVSDDGGAHGLPNNVKVYSTSRCYFIAQLNQPDYVRSKGAGTKEGYVPIYLTYIYLHNARSYIIKLYMIIPSSDHREEEYVFFAQAAS